MTLESSNAISAYNSALNRLKETPDNSGSGQVNANDFTQMVKNFAESADPPVTVPRIMPKHLKLESYR